MGVRYSAPVQIGTEIHRNSCSLDTRSFSELQHMGHGIDHPPNIELKEKVESYLFSTSRPSWSVIE